jgi:hypothetical protein
VLPLANTPLASLVSAGADLDGSLNLSTSPIGYSFSGDASLSVLGTTIGGSLQISSSKGLVVSGTLESSGSGGVSGFNHSYSSDITVTAGIHTAGTAYYSVEGYVDGTITVFWAPSSFDIPINDSGQVNLNQLVQVVDSDLNNWCNDFWNWLKSEF